MSGLDSAASAKSGLSTRLTARKRFHARRNVKTTTGIAIADEKRLKDQAEQELKAAHDWEQKAMLAIKENRDDLAKQALVRQTEHYEHAQSLNATWQAHALETEKLKNSLRDLNDKIEEAKRKKHILIARQRRAEAQQRIAATMSSMSDKSAFEAFARMEEKVNQNERMIKASSEIDEEISGDKLASDFKRLEKVAGSASADQYFSIQGMYGSTWRSDVDREADLIEEVIRVYGYDKVPDEVPVPMAASHRPTANRVWDKVRRALTGCGFDEAPRAAVNSYK